MEFQEINILVITLETINTKYSCMSKGRKTEKINAWQNSK